MPVKLVIPNMDACVGCRSCELACSLTHHGVCNPERSAIRVLKKGLELDIPLVCSHGSACAVECAAACPVEAISVGEDGIVNLDREACTGCGACELACPLRGVRVFDGKAYKCDLCGGDPACVKVCNHHALAYAEPEPDAWSPYSQFREVRM